MAITTRPYVAETDFARVDALMRAAPATTPHIYDFPWRYSSPTSQTGRDIYVWQDDIQNDKLLAVAAWQRYWALLDFVVLPGPGQGEIEAQVFAWAEQRFQDLNRENGNTYPYWVEFRDDDPERKSLVMQYGYTVEQEVPYVFMERPLVGSIPEPILPEGFTLRTLHSSEVEAYMVLHRAAFESTSMTVDWRTRTLTAPRYLSDFDIVAVAPDGKLAGFCVAWYDAQQRVGQIEPMGVHPQYQHLGLARILMLEMFHRFQQLGAHTIYVETEGDRGPARAAYEAVGFRVTHTFCLRGKYV